MKLRASWANLLAKCQAAAYGDGDKVIINRSDTAGAIGDATHEAGSKIVQGLEFDTAELAARYGLDEAAKRRMLYMIGVIFRWWTKHEASFTADDGTLRVLDFKTTRLKDVQYDPQLWEYLYLGMDFLFSGLSVEQELAVGDCTGHPDVMFVPSEAVERCQYVILFLDDETHAISPMIPAQEVLDHHKEYVARIEQWDRKTYCTSGHCWYCGRCATCPGLCAELANSTRFQILQRDDPEGRLAHLTDAQCVSMWDQIGLAVKFLERAREIIKLRAIAQGNVLEGDGRHLVIEEQIRHPVKPLPAWPILQQYLTDAELAPAVSISKTVALAAIAAKAPRGQKGRVREKVEAELAAFDALDEERILFPRLVPLNTASGQALIEGA